MARREENRPDLRESLQSTSGARDLTYGHGDTTAAEHAATHHHISVGVYLRVFFALMVLLVLTLLAAIPDMGALNLPIALAIAIAKAVLVLVYFMHLRISTNLVRLFATMAFLWLGILFFLTISDYISRGWLPMVRP